MRRIAKPVVPAALCAAVLFCTLGAGYAVASAADASISTAKAAKAGEVLDPVVRSMTADAAGTTGRELDPRYEPSDPEPPSSYNDDYFFALTRGVSDSTMHPAAKVPLFLLTVPLDLVFLPFAAIGGLFG